jgi:MoaD family protein
MSGSRQGEGAGNLMMVNFYASLRQTVGAKTVEIPLCRKTTIRQLVAEIVNRYPDMRSELLDKDGEIYGHVHIVVNGRDLPFLENAQETVLSQGDRLDIFPAIGGGDSDRC